MEIGIVRIKIAGFFRNMISNIVLILIMKYLSLDSKLQ